MWATSKFPIKHCLEYFAFGFLKITPITKFLIREAHSRNFYWNCSNFVKLFAFPEDFLFWRRLSTKANLASNTVPGFYSHKWEIFPHFPFSQIDLDYCGTFNTKDTRGSLQKTCVALFISFSTKGVHIETMRTLRKDDWLNAIKRFTALGMQGNSKNSKTFIVTRGEVEFRKLLIDQGLRDTTLTGWPLPHGHQFLEDFGRQV